MSWQNSSQLQDGFLLALQDREQIQLSFCTGKVKVVVATVAFGMGVDAQGVRGVVHLTLPRSLEEYVQQVSHRSRQRASAWQAGLPIVVFSTFLTLYSCYPHAFKKLPIQYGCMQACQAYSIRQAGCLALPCRKSAFVYTTTDSSLCVV